MNQYDAPGVSRLTVCEVWPSLATLTEVNAARQSSPAATAASWSARETQPMR